MKFYYKLLFAVLLLFCSTGYSNNLQSKELEHSYSTIYGWLSIIFESNRELDKKCETSLSSLELINEADYLLRNKTGYSYSEWSTEIADIKYQNDKVNEAVENMLSNLGGCDKRKLQLINEQSSIKVKQLILELRTLNELYSLRKLSRSDEQIVQQFRTKLNNYQQLPIDEVRELVTSLEFGNYSYALNSPMVKIDIDFEKASILKAYLKAIDKN